MRAVEDDHLTLTWRALMNSPEEIVRGLFFARLLESVNERSLRIHRAEHVSDGAVFAGSVERLEHDEQ
jgi:hypothetical protein